MLWMKAWLETRSRVAFVFVWGGSFLGLYMGANGGELLTKGENLGGLLGVMAFIWVFTPLYLSGSGIRTQAPFGRQSKGLHGSTQYTVSLPVSRARLLLTRTALGLIEMSVVALVFCLLFWLFTPAVRSTTTAGDWAAFGLTVVACGSGVYGIAVVAATLVDDAWIVSLGTVAVVLLWVFQFVGLIPQQVNIFQPLVGASPLVTHALPWGPMIVSIGIFAVGVLTALRIVNRQEY